MKVTALLVEFILEWSKKIKQIVEKLNLIFVMRNDNSRYRV